MKPEGKKQILIINKQIFVFDFLIRIGVLSGREGCVIESALKSNKHRVVWVLLAGANISR